MMNWGNFGWGMGFGGIFMLALWAAVIVVIVLFVKWIANKTESETKHSASLDVLKRQYAQGEITKEQYERMKKEF